MRALTPRDRRALLLGLVLLAPSLFYIWGVKPYLATLAEARDRLAVSRMALAQDRALIALAPASDSLRLALDSVLQAAEVQLFDAHDDDIAAAELGAYIAELARNNQVWLQAVTGREPQVSPGGVRTLGVEIRAESDFQGITTFLRALESGDRLTRVEQLSLVPAPDTSGSRQALQLRATVLGYALGEPPPAMVAKPSGRGRR